MEHLIGVWGDVLAGAVVLALVAACAHILARIGRHPPKVRPVAEVALPAEVAAAIEGPRRLDPAQEWSLVVRRATQGFERAAALAALQAEAAIKIAATEHAFNRLVADCAKLCLQSVAPTVVPPPQRVTGPRRSPRALERSAERQPLAA